MGVYIKNMKMPEDGETVTLTICADGLVFEEFKEPGDVFHAVPVPPHGRLIDAGANLAVMMRVIDAPYTRRGKIDTAMLKACIKMFEEAPTIIPAEEEKDGQQAAD
ncbi:MAG: hypothetical protein IIZ96_05025 [Oscillospiraceae bacterium]|nr:hypothetical protein [Oscillospiraceae bacterium]